MLTAWVDFDGAELLPPVLVLLGDGLALAAARPASLRLVLVLLRGLLALLAESLLARADLRRAHFGFSSSANRTRATAAPKALVATSLLRMALAAQRSICVASISCPA